MAAISSGFTWKPARWYSGAVSHGIIAMMPATQALNPPTNGGLVGEFGQPVSGGQVALKDATLEDLMERYAGGDDRAFTALHKKISGRLYGFFMRGGCSPQLARDLTQQTFMRVHIARSRYHIGAPLLPWLFTIAYRVRVDEQRRRGRRPEAQLDPEHQNRLRAPEKEEPSDMVLALRAAVEQLPDGQRQVVMLHKFQGFSMAEVAEVVGSTESAVKVRAHRAYKALKKILREVKEGSHEL